MIETKQTRGLTLRDGKKTSLNLETATWAAIDYIAAQEGITWQRWANNVVGANPDAINASSVIRASVVDYLLTRQLAVDMEARTQVLDQDHEIIGKEYYRIDDEALQSELDVARVTHRDSAFDGFEIIAGYRGVPGEPAAPFLCVRSALRDDMHAFIVQTHEAEQ
jgi:predicted DNA-binding ribbon-helix-helix protein